MSNARSEPLALPGDRSAQTGLVRLPAIVRPDVAGPVLLLAVTAWIAHFLHAGSFGLYEDDYFFVANAMGKDPSYLVDRLKVFTTWPQGRPVGFFLPDLLTFVGDKLGGLHAIYLIGFFIVTLNSYLVFRLLKINHTGLVALTGALSFCLFPADTTKILLTHAFQLQPSLTFFLIAGISYLSGFKLLSYAASVASLLSYESAFMVLLGLPLLKTRWDRKLILETAIHAIILVGILACAIAIRALVAEDRVVGTTANLPQVLPKIAASMVIGPIRSLLLLVYGPVTAIRGWDGEALLVFLLTLSLWVWVLARLSPGTSGQERNRPAPTSWLRPPMPRGLHALLVSSRAAQLFLTGIVLLALGYALAFTHFPPTAVVGRGTSVHLAATIGGSVLFASLASGLLLVARAPWMRACVVALLSVYFSLLVAYHLTIQRDFAKSWEIQRAFWTSVAALAPDLADGTVLIFESESPSETRFIDTNSWADPLVLRHIYRFPNGWQNPPRLFTVERGWTRRVQAEDDRLHWWVPAATWNEHWEDLPDSNVILLRRVDGRLTRIDGSIALQGKMLMLKPREPRASGQWEKGPLYGYLIDSRLDSPRQASPSG